MNTPITQMIWPAIAAMFAAIFVTLWYAEKTRLHLLSFALGFLALAIAMAIHIAFPALSPAQITPILHFLACLSVIAIVWGAANRVGQRIPLAAMAGITVVSCVLLWASMESDVKAAALIVQNGATSILFGIGAIALWYAIPAGLLDKILIWLMGLQAALGLARPALVLLAEGELDRVMARASSFSAVLLIGLTLLTAALGLTLIALAIVEGIEIKNKRSKIDPVSAFYDRTTFEALAETTFNRAGRLGLPSTLILLAIDRFDAIKQDWGEEASDMVLRAISDCVRQCQRDGDLIGRTAEDQIGILLVGTASRPALKLVDDLRAEVDRVCNSYIKGAARLTLSASIAESGKATSFQVISREAERSLSLARQTGPNGLFLNGTEYSGASVSDLPEVRLSSFG